MFLGHPNTDVTLVYSSRKEPLQKLAIANSRNRVSEVDLWDQAYIFGSETRFLPTMIFGYKSQRRYHQGHSLAFEL